VLCCDSLPYCCSCSCEADNSVPSLHPSNTCRLIRAQPPRSADVCLVSIHADAHRHTHASSYVPTWWYSHTPTHAGAHSLSFGCVKMSENTSVSSFWCVQTTLSLLIREDTWRYTPSLCYKPAHENAQSPLDTG
jgi:hypothetical protein